MEGRHIKIFYAGQIRRLQLVTPTYETLNGALTQVFPQLCVDQTILKYKDDEGDLVTISSDTELQNALSLLGPNGLLRLHLFDPKESSAPGSVDQFLTPELAVPVDWKHLKRERKEQKRLLKKHYKKEGKWSRPKVQREWRSEKQEWKKMQKLAKKNPEKLAFLAQYNAAFEPDRSVAVSKQPNSPLTFNATIKNVGSETWPIGTTLKSIGKCKTLTSLPSIILTEIVPSSALVPISLTFPSPASGNHLGKWRLFLPDGRKFGPKFIIKIRAVGEFVNRKACGRRGGCRGGRGRARGVHQWHPYRDRSAQFEDDIRKLRELGFEGPSVVDALRRFRGDINLVLDHLNVSIPPQAPPQTPPQVPPHVTAVDDMRE